MGAVFSGVQLTAGRNSSRDADVRTFWSSCISRLPNKVKLSLTTYSSLRMTSHKETLFCYVTVPFCDGFCTTNHWRWWAGELSRYSDWLRAGRSGDRIPVWARFSAPVQTGPAAHPATCTMDTGSFPGVESGRGVPLTPHRLLCRNLKTDYRYT
jgi:hypothetical protein